MKLAKVNLGPDWIDLSYGEPRIVLDTLTKYVNRAEASKNPLHIPDPNSDMPRWEYQPAQGYPPLTDFLEKKYGSKVVITNGAKQGMSAVFYALKKMGHTALCIHRPHWVSTPELIEHAGLKVEYIDKDIYESTAFMVTSPNNPDGKDLTRENINLLVAEARAEGITLIHDAAYYTPIYVKDTSSILNFGDAQIYSISKMYGVSGLRIGYVVCHNEALLEHVVEYVEKTTAGVSIASQKAVYAIEMFFDGRPKLLARFEKECRDKLKESRKILTSLNPEVLEVPSDFVEQNGMFAWLKKGPRLDNVKAKVHFVDGGIFGDSTKVRINIAYPKDLIEEAVRRLNSV